jgi:predicted outer membrane repeat protein
MRVAFSGLVLLWIASHIVQIHGDDILVDPPATTAPRDRKIPLQTASFYLVYLPLNLLVLFFSKQQISRRKLRRERRSCRLFLPSDCICREQQLVRAIGENQHAKICLETTITIQREIDITGKNFSITCARPKIDRGTDVTDKSFGTVFPRGDICKILGSGNHRLFHGSPTNASIQSVHIENGSASEGGVALLTGGWARFDRCLMSQNRATGNGGAIRITGGTVEIMGWFYYNSAVGDGGAISASGSSTNVTMRAFAAANNSATNGGTVSVVDGAQVRVSGNYFGNSAKVNGGVVYIRNATVNASVLGSVGNSAGSNGGSLYVKNARLSIQQSSFAFDTVSKTRNNTLWIDDDDNPSDVGSFVSCNGPSNTIYLCEIATGPNNAQKFNNTNCLDPFIAPVAPTILYIPLRAPPLPTPYSVMVSPPS